jgi:hypothetical protein
LSEFTGELEMGTLSDKIDDINRACWVSPERKEEEFKKLFSQPDEKDQALAEQVAKAVADKLISPEPDPEEEHRKFMADFYPSMADMVGK